MVSVMTSNIVYKPLTPLRGFSKDSNLCYSGVCGLACMLNLYTYMYALMISRADGILVGSAPAMQAM